MTVLQFRKNKENWSRDLYLSMERYQENILRSCTKIPSTDVNIRYDSKNLSTQYRGVRQADPGSSWAARLDKTVSPRPSQRSVLEEIRSAKCWLLALTHIGKWSWIEPCPHKHTHARQTSGPVYNCVHTNTHTHKIDKWSCVQPGHMQDRQVILDTIMHTHTDTYTQVHFPLSYIHQKKRK